MHKEATAVDLRRLTDEQARERLQAIVCRGDLKLLLGARLANTMRAEGLRGAKAAASMLGEAAAYLADAESSEIDPRALRAARKIPLEAAARIAAEAATKLDEAWMQIVIETTEEIRAATGIAEEEERLRADEREEDPCVRGAPRDAEGCLAMPAPLAQ